MSSRFRLLLVLACLTAAVSPAQAGLYLYIQQTPGGVVVTASGSLNLTGLTPLSTIYGERPVIDADAGMLEVGAISPVNTFDGLTFPATGYTFGMGNSINPQSAEGAPFGLYAGGNSFSVPAGYVSGTPISGGSDTFVNATYSFLGVTPGTYVYGINSGVNADTITVSTVAPAPEPSTWAMVSLAAISVGVGMLRCRRVA